MALNLEKNVSKETVLEAYMNTVYMSHGCYGVQTAAETYFGKNCAGPEPCRMCVACRDYAVTLGERPVAAPGCQPSPPNDLFE